MAKNSPKSLIVCPEISSDRPGVISVENNSNNTAKVVTIKMLVGAPTTKKSKKGKEFVQSGVLTINSLIEIDGVKHRITLNSGWFEGRRVGDPEIVIKPVEEREEIATPAATIPW